MMIDTDTLLAWGAVYKQANAGEVLFSEGSVCQYYNQLVSGTIKWVNIDDEGREYIQDIIEPGESFGELPLFDEGLYSASAIAEENVVVIRLRKATFHQLIKENFLIHFNFSKLLAKRVRFKFLITKTISNKIPEFRIMTLLTYLKQEQKSICPNCNQVKLTRQQIADMTGLRVETVIRVMRNMHEKGELVIERGKIYL